jgi:DHA1 family multidrug resistance protein-like MFS transporter
MLNPAFITLFSSIFAASLGIGMVSPLMPIYSQSLGAKGIWLGAIFSGFSLARIIFMPLVGGLSDKRGRKIFISLGLLFYAVLSLGYIFSQNMQQLIAVRFLHGVASAMVVPIAMAYIGEISPQGEEGKYLGTFNIALFFGFGMGPLLGGVVTDKFSQSVSFLAMGGLSLISFLAVLFFLPKSDKYQTRSPGRRVSFRLLLKDRMLQGLVIFRAFYAFGRGLVVTFLPIVAISQRINLTKIGVLVSSTILLNSVLQYPFGKMADRYDKKKLLLLGSGISALMLFLIPFGDNFLKLLLIALVLGIGGGISMPAGTALAVVVGKRRSGMGSTMGIYSMAMSAGLIFGPLTGGVIQGSWGINQVFFLGGLISVLGIIGFYLMMLS